MEPCWLSVAAFDVHGIAAGHMPTSPSPSTRRRHPGRPQTPKRLTGPAPHYSTRLGPLRSLRRVEADPPSACGRLAPDAEREIHMITPAYEEATLSVRQLLLRPNNFRFQDEEDWVRADSTRFAETSVQERATRRIRSEGIVNLRTRSLVTGSWLSSVWLYVSTRSMTTERPFTLYSKATAGLQRSSGSNRTTRRGSLSPSRCWPSWKRCQSSSSGLKMTRAPTSRLWEFGTWGASVNGADIRGRNS